MTNRLHPTINDTLETFFNAIGATQAPTRADALPALKQGLQRLDWPTTGYLKRPDSLPVDVFYYGGSAGKRENGVPLEPDEPAGAEVQSVWLAGVNIAPLLSESLLSEIEDYALRVIGG